MSQDMYRDVGMSGLAIRSIGHGLAVGLVLILSACGQRSPVETMEAYLRARVASDAETLRSLACAEWEAQALLEAESFRAVEARLEGLACRESGQQGAYTLVTCEGRLLATYDGETHEWPLGTYRLTQEDSEWKMCGEAERPDP